MPRLLSTVVALLVFLTSAGAASSGAAQATGVPAPPGPPGPLGPLGNDAMNSGVTRLERAEYAEALKDFEKALDSYAGTERLEDAKRAYMQMFVGNRTYANVLMKAMKTWVDKHRTDAAGLAPAAFAAFDAWVQERDALAAATINLVHNSPDWK